MNSTSTWQRRSDAQKKRFAKYAVWNKGKQLSTKTRRKMSISAKTRKRTPCTEKTKKLLSASLKGRALSVEHKRKLRVATLANPNRKFSNTKIEQKIAAELENRGLVRNIDFFQNFGIADIKNVDFFLPQQSIVIECDGCYWHSCQLHYPNVRQEYRKLDNITAERLKRAGYSVYRFWEHEINQSANACVEKCYNEKKLLVISKEAG